MTRGLALFGGGLVICALGLGATRLITSLLVPQGTGPSSGGVCGNDLVCAPDAVCASDPLEQGTACLRSNCAEDADCPPNQRCTLLALRPRALLRCSWTGQVAEGGRCSLVPKGPAEACAPGLLCNGNLCGRPCELGTAGTCPPKMTCVDGELGPSCVPTCLPGECDAGATCLDLGAFSTCATIRGQNCQEVPCAQGEDCVTLLDPTRDGTAAMSCRAVCADSAACGPGHICQGGYCWRHCRVRGNDCPTGEKCLPVPGDVAGALTHCEP